MSDEVLPASISESENLSRHCRLQDGHRCVIDASLANNIWDERGRPVGEDHADLVVAHIIPYAYANYKDAAVRVSSSFHFDDTCELMFRPQ